MERINWVCFWASPPRSIVRRAIGTVSKAAASRHHGISQQSCKLDSLTHSSHIRPRAHSLTCRLPVPANWLGPDLTMIEPLLMESDPGGSKVSHSHPSFPTESAVRRFEIPSNSTTEHGTQRPHNQLDVRKSLPSTGPCLHLLLHADMLSTITRPIGLVLSRPR